MRRTPLKMQALIQKQIENAIALRKPASSLPWRPDEPWKQPFYRWSSKANGWQQLQASEPSPNKFKATKVAIYSWNIDFMLPHGDSRMNSALKHLEELSHQHRSDEQTAVVINIQECVPSDLTLIGEKSWIRDAFYRTDVDTANWASGAYGTTTLIDRRLEVLSCFRVHYSATRMERDALFIDATSNGQKLRLCNTHLESLAMEPPRRPAQMRLIASHMHADDLSGAVVTGDFNAIQPFDRALHTDNDLEDAYLKLGGKEGDGRDDNEGYTWGQQALPELRQLFGCSRMDKVFFCGDGLKILEFERFGAGVEPEESEEDVRKDLLSFGFEKPWITDHLGVKAVFEIKS
jgi:tyrosyl-DNA phosphodiesterase 2